MSEIDTSNDLENFNNQFDKILSSITKLKTENEILERVKNQSILSLIQYQEDYNNLKQINLKLRQDLNLFSQTSSEKSNITSADEINHSEPSNTPLPFPISPTLNENLPLESILSNPSETSMLAHVNPTWSIDSHNSRYNRSTITLNYALNTESILCSIRFSLDGSLFAFADGKTAFIMNSSDGSLVSACEIPDESHQTDPHTRDIVFSPDSRYLVISGPTDTIIVFDVNESNVVTILDGHDGEVPALVFTKDSKTLISGGFDGKLIVWDMETFQQKLTILHDPSIIPNNLLNQTKNPGTIKNNLNNNSNSNNLNNNSNSNNLNNNSNSNNLNNNSEEKGKNLMIIALALAHDESFLAVGFMNGFVGIYELTFEQPIKIFEAHHEFIYKISISPDDSLIATSSHDTTTKLWTIGPIIKCIKQLKGHTDFVVSSSFSPDGKFIFTGSKDETICCWDVESGALLYVLIIQKNTVFQVDHHPKTQSFISCSADGLICVWNYTS